MPAPLTEPLTGRWIEEQLELCKKATPGPWHIGERGGPSGPFHSLVNPAGHVVAMMIDSTPDAQCMAAAREGYPATLEALQTAQGELRIVYAILQGLHVAIDAMSHENIKEVVGQLLIAGVDWLEKEQADASTEV